MRNILKTNTRRALLFVLIIFVLLAQIGVAYQFYQENKHEKKLEQLEEKIAESNQINNLTSQCNQNLLGAQELLRKFILTQNKDTLNAYFEAIKNITRDLEQLETFPPLQMELQKQKANISLNLPSINRIKILVDSTQTVVNETHKDDYSYQLKPFKLKSGNDFLDIQIEKTTDSVKKSGLFTRLKKAVKNESEVQTETITITTKKGNLTSLEQLQHEFDSILNVANRHYKREVEVYKNRLKIIEKDNQQLYPIFDDLLASSNQLIRVYSLAVNHYIEDLQQQRDQLNSKGKKLKENAILGLQLFMIFISLVIIYLAVQSFRREKKLERANKTIQENLNFKNRVLGMFSHEMRAPMQIMNLLLGRIAKVAQVDEVKEHIKTIQFTNNSLLIQANQILQYTKDPSKQQNLQKSKVLLKENLDTLMASFQPFIASRNNQFDVQTQIDSKLEVYTDIAKIHQIFTNILSNANKFTENGTIKADIKVVNEKENLYLLKAQIKDSGIGISKKDLEAVFEPYYQGIISNKVENMGVGLGLNLCKELVQLFNGNISATSEEGKGTQINFSLYLNKTQ